MIAAILILYFLNYLIRTKASIQFNKYYSIFFLCLTVGILIFALLNKKYEIGVVALVCGYTLFRRIKLFHKTP